MTDSQKKTIVIIGFGYVGKAMYRLFANRQDIYNLVVVEKDCQTKTEMVDGFDEPIDFVGYDIANQADLAIVCVPTPMRGNGSCNTDAVQDVNVQLSPQVLTLLKSTVPPGTIQSLFPHWCFSPEFIGEGHYHVDATKYLHPTDIIEHKFQIFGGDKRMTSRIIQFFIPVMGASVEYIQTDTTTAELVKYLVNCWAAMKVTFFNEFYDVCQLAGVSFEEVRQLALKDTRIEPMHTLVFANKRGYGGKCLPKDTNALLAWVRSLGGDFKLLEATIKRNETLTNGQ